MSHRHVRLHVSPEVTRLGVQARGLDVAGLVNRDSDPGFEERKAALAERLLREYDETFLRHDPILEGFRTVRREIGRSARRYPASPEQLLGFLRRTGHLMSINLAVDLYNAVSVETRLTLGAHDADRFPGDVHLRLARGGEEFQPLGSRRTERVAPGDYCYFDGSGAVLCRLDYRQAERTKLTPETRHGFFIVQGNPATPPEEIDRTLRRLAELVETYCSGPVTEIRFRQYPSV